MAAAARVDLLGVQPERAGERQQLLAQLPGPLLLADLDERRHQPERADGERAFLARQPVVGLLDAVAQHQPVDGELVGDRQHRGADPRVVGRQEAQQRHQQERRVQRVGVVVLREHAALVEGVGADVGVDLVGRRSPALGQLVLLPDAGQRAPRSAATQHITLDEVKCCGLAAHLPDAAVGLAPVLDRALDLPFEDRPDAARRAGRATWCGCRPSRAPRPTRRAGAGRRRRCRSAPAWRSS